MKTRILIHIRDDERVELLVVGATTRRVLWAAIVSEQRPWSAWLAWLASFPA